MSISFFRLSCVIATREMCWSLSIRAYLVIIAGTESYDGKVERCGARSLLLVSSFKFLFPLSGTSLH